MDVRNIQWTENRFQNDKLQADLADHFSEIEIEKTMHFHSGVPQYEMTPLHHLSSLAEHVGVGSIYVKDESYRFGLNAFKGLGALYAMANYFADALSLDLYTIDFKTLIEKVKSLPPKMFATTTDGNHGKAVAWAAKVLGQKAKVFMPKGSSQARVEAIESFGAEVQVTGLNYDDTVQKVRELAVESDWILMQDTAWEGYETIPLHVMQGYLTIVGEIRKQLEWEKFKEITHVFLQAGVGSFTAAVAAGIYNLISENHPKIIVVEPENAACFYESALDPSGGPKQVYGDLATMMAGLSCGAPNPIAWDILKNISHSFLTLDDSLSARGMRVLGNPLLGDPRIVSGESGAAVSVGLIYELVQDENREDIREKLGLDENSNILVINTEGDTDPKNYRHIVWG